MPLTAYLIFRALFRREIGMACTLYRVSVTVNFVSTAVNAKDEMSKLDWVTLKQSLSSPIFTFRA